VNEITTNKISLGPILTLIGAGLIAVGVFLPWVKISVLMFGTDLNGMSQNLQVDGWIALGTAAALAAMAIARLFAYEDIVLANKVVGLLATVGAAVEMGWITHRVGVAKDALASDPDYGTFADLVQISIGFGLIVMIVSAALALAGAFLKRSVPEEPAQPESDKTMYEQLRDAESAQV
jgi:hypothetical protein